ncbi:MAG: hypothetical protein R3C03_12270 [Pirellulaceae bacterium]
MSKKFACLIPTPASGRLGFVRHSFRRGNWFEELGNVFIGTAPLLGGSVLLYTFLLVLYPDLAKELMQHESLKQATSWSSLITGMGTAFLDFLASMFLANLATFRLWIFLYLTLCVASHMAPSRSDYLGAPEAFGGFRLA